MSDKVGKKYDLLKLLGTGMGPVQKAMGRTFFFIALKHGADSFFLQSPAMGRVLFFSTALKPMRRYLQKKCSCNYIFA